MHIDTEQDYYFIRGCKVLWWASLSVSVCLSARISPEPRVRFLPNFLWVLPVSVAQPFSGKAKLI